MKKSRDKKNVDTFLFSRKNIKGWLLLERKEAGTNGKGTIVSGI
jgi:hypothetical protein